MLGRPHVFSLDGRISAPDPVLSLPFLLFLNQRFSFSLSHFMLNSYHDGFLGQRIGPISCVAFHPFQVRLDSSLLPNRLKQSNYHASEQF